MVGQAGAPGQILNEVCAVLVAGVGGAAGVDGDAELGETGEAGGDDGVVDLSEEVGGVETVGFDLPGWGGGVDVGVFDDWLVGSVAGFEAAVLDELGITGGGEWSA